MDDAMYGDELGFDEGIDDSGSMAGSMDLDYDSGDDEYDDGADYSDSGEYSSDDDYLANDEYEAAEEYTDDEESGGDYYTELLDAISGVEPQSEIERAVQNLLPELVTQNRRLHDDLNTFRQEAMEREQRAAFQAVDETISSTAEQYGLELDQDSRVELAEDASMILEGAVSLGRQMSIEEAFDRAARGMAMNTSRELTRRANARIDAAKELVSLSRPRQVRGPVSRELPDQVSREDRMMRCYRIAGGTD